MSKFKIELTENGVSILAKKQRTLFDADGNEVVIDEGNHRGSIGLGDFPDEASFKAAVANMIEARFGKPLSDGIADIKTAIDRTSALEDEKISLTAERDAQAAIIEEMDSDMDLKIKELDRIETEVAQLKAELSTVKADNLTLSNERDVLVESEASLQASLATAQSELENERTLKEEALSRVSALEGSLVAPAPASEKGDKL